MDVNPALQNITDVVNQNTKAFIPTNTSTSKTKT